jgi:ribonuclease R
MSKKHKKHKKLVPEIVSGTYISNARGFGFLEVEGREEDLFISEEYRNTAFHKDLVEAEILPGKSSGKRKEAKVLRVLERGTRQIVGTFERTKESYGFVIPDNVKLSTDLFVPVERSKGAVTGHKVVAEITDFGTANRSPEAKIVEILGHVNDPGVDILSIVKDLNIPTFEMVWLLQLVSEYKSLCSNHKQRQNSEAKKLLQIVR